MNFRFLSNENIYLEMGERVKNYRISMNLTQAQLAQKCGMPKRSVERIENGENRNLDNFLAVLIPKQENRPTEIIEKKTVKKRVYHKKSETIKNSVKWGDE